MKYPKIKITSLVLFASILSFFAFKPNDSIQGKTFTKENTQPEELGKVKWERDFNKGLTKSEKENKPVFLLFQEVPGCSTCRNYGNDVLSHPQIVEAIETLFVPVAIFNNKKGKDAEVLKYYGEPSWNNPVVRIVNAEKKNLIQRVNGNYSKLGIVHAMVFALQAAEKEVPTYLDLLKQSLEAEASGMETATFSMYCFWTGEKKLGSMDGVVETQPGFKNGHEVVEVKYNPILISKVKLVEAAKDSNFSLMEKKSKFRMDKEPKYYLSNSVYRFIPMTQLQATKVNAKIGSRQSPDKYLSPRQLKLLKEIKKNPKKKWKSAINVDLEKAWERVD